MFPVFALLVWYVEYRCRSHASESALGKRFFSRPIPEMVGLALITGIVALLLACCREDRTLQLDQAWIDVKREWPLLTTADTLIGLQALLRLVLLCSATLRRTGAQMSPMDGEPAAFFLLAAIVRVTLLILSPRDVYHLDGPLGGDMNVAVEITALLLLLPLGFRILHKGIWRITALTLVVLLVVAFARSNHFALADTSLSHLDMLFSLVMLLEIVAGVAFYVRSSTAKGGYAWDTFTGFAHCILPLQQALPAYFLLVAFAPPFTAEPSLVGKGRPFELLQAGGLLQLFMYGLAAAMYCMACVKENEVSAYATPVLPSEAPSSDECVICLGSCEACGDTENSMPQQWRRLRCGHHFHEHCIFEWFKKSQRCPMCRRHIWEKAESECAGSPSDISGVANAINGHIDSSMEEGTYSNRTN
jgi:hypothetical protein